MLILHSFLFKTRQPVQQHPVFDLSYLIGDLVLLMEGERRIRAHKFLIPEENKTGMSLTD